MATSPKIQQFPCSACGAALEFNPKVNRMKCPYCGHDEAVPQIQGRFAEHDYDERQILQASKTALLSPQIVEVDCPGCRAVVTFEPPQVAGQCPFCGKNIVTQPHSAHPGLTPDAVIPFKVGRKETQSLIQKWISQRWFAPSSLKHLAQHEQLQGVYLPFWLYKTDTMTQYRGERGDAYYVTVTRTRTNSEGKQETYQAQERRIRWRPASGTVRCSFKDLLVTATQAVNEQRLAELEPWQLSSLVPYQANYLAGFKAQRYQTNVIQGFDGAKEQMAPQIHTAICRDIGGDEQRVHSSQTDYLDTKYSHVLMPVWLGAYRYKSKQYQVMVNAQTGEVLGDRPWSIFKISMAVLAGLAVIGGILLARSGALEGIFQPDPPPNPPPTQIEPQLPSMSLPPDSTTDTAFQQAMGTATQAASLTQTAQTPQNWQQVAGLWIQAIEQLKRVPTFSPNYSKAQQKIQEYQRNLNYARERANL
ncbi:MAG: hypothetical protein VKK04_14370 [Synechococcales bacterium]|nr:hypothetical protein [Synechococcales bacterium]